jgi:hypothetical protein
MLLIANGFFCCILEDTSETDELWLATPSAGLIDATWWFCVETSSGWCRLAISYEKAAPQLIDGDVICPGPRWRIVAGSSQN